MHQMFKINGIDFCEMTKQVFSNHFFNYKIALSTLLNIEIQSKESAHMIISGRYDPCYSRTHSINILSVILDYGPFQRLLR